MRTISYKKFSFNTHKKNWRKGKPNVCQFELTFGCGLNCRYCYTSCYNKKRYLGGQLTTRQVKNILDKLYAAGITWMCFTGGDPLYRKDFLEIYSYAKNKGFIITLFTNAYSVTSGIADYLKKHPPFVIEITLNAVDERTYENISQVKGSFFKVMNGLKLILKAGLPLKIKTQVIKENFKEVPRIKKFVSSLGLRFRPNAILHARLDGDLAPCHLRITPPEIFKLNGNSVSTIDECNLLPITKYQVPITKLFPCAIGGQDGIYLDPYGNIFPCICIREPKVNLINSDVEAARRKILAWLETQRFTYDVKCRTCTVRRLCNSCPGKALLEVSDMEAPVPYFCALANLKAKNYIK